MKALGYHYLIELYECQSDTLKNADLIEDILRQAVKKSHSHEIGRIFHRFSPHGMSGVILISESHFSIHTWPEYNYAAVDFFTCTNENKISEAYSFLVKQLNSKRHSITEIKRGIDLTD